MFNINDIRSVLNKHGVARPSNFAVNITPPLEIYDSFVNDLPFLADTANVPAVTLTTQDYKHKGYGLSEARASGISFEPLTLTIIGDGSGKVLEFLEKWMSLVYNFNGEKEESSYGIGAELINYPVDYWGTFELYMYDIASQKYHTYKMAKAYPTSIGPVQLGWEQTDSLMHIGLNVTYRSMSTSVTEQLSSQSTPINTQRDSRARNIDALDKILTNPDIQQYKQRFDTIN